MESRSTTVPGAPGGNVPPRGEDTARAPVAGRGSPVPDPAGAGRESAGGGFAGPAPVRGRGTPRSPRGEGLEGALPLHPSIAFPPLPPDSSVPDPLPASAPVMLPAPAAVPARFPRVPAAWRSCSVTPIAPRSRAWSADGVPRGTRLVSRETSPREARTSRVRDAVPGRASAARRTPDPPHTGQAAGDRPPAVGHPGSRTARVPAPESLDVASARVMAWTAAARRASLAHRVRRAASNLPPRGGPVHGSWRGAWRPPGSPLGGTVDSPLRGTVPPAPSPASHREGREAGASHHWAISCRARRSNSSDSRETGGGAGLGTISPTGSGRPACRPRSGSAGAPEAPDVPGAPGAPEPSGRWPPVRRIGAPVPIPPAPAGSRGAPGASAATAAPMTPPVPVVPSVPIAPAFPAATAGASGAAVPRCRGPVPPLPGVPLPPCRAGAPAPVAHDGFPPAARSSAGRLPRPEAETSERSSRGVRSTRLQLSRIREILSSSGHRRGGGAIPCLPRMKVGRTAPSRRSSCSPVPFDPLATSRASLPAPRAITGSPCPRGRRARHLPARRRSRPGGPPPTYRHVGPSG